MWASFRQPRELWSSGPAAIPPGPAAPPSGADRGTEEEESKLAFGGVASSFYPETAPSPAQLSRRRWKLHEIRRGLNCRSFCRAVPKKNSNLLIAFLSLGLPKINIHSQNLLTSIPSPIGLWLVLLIARLGQRQEPEINL